MLDHYAEWGAKSEQQRKISDDADLDKSNTLLTELLLKMGKSLNYSFDRVVIKKGFYYPEGLVNIEKEQHALRGTVLNLLSGKGAKLPVAVFEQKFGAISVEPLTEDKKQQS